MKQIYSFCCIFALFLVSSIYAQENRETWRGILPLHTTKQEVEEIVKGLKRNTNSSYETEKETIFINYTSGKCDGNGWNVVPDTVLDYQVYSKRREKINEVNKTYTNLILTSDDAGYRYFTEVKNGLQYLVDTEDVVEFIRYVPTSDDSKFRCQGFPKYDPVSEHYRPYSKYEFKGSKWDVYRIGSFLAQLQSLTDHKGFIILYLKKQSSTQIKKQYLSKINDFVFDKNKIKTEKVKIIFGGYRDNSELELFLIPSSYPETIPTPKYSQ
jgi:hypothetical protein